jgi:7,8-dihydroneopterin aldolase/epimerase/oxygenase
MQYDSGIQILSIKGLRFQANLGILNHETTHPQPIQVDAELNMGERTLLPEDSDISKVLDYRKVREIIIAECTERHIDLLESMIGKLCLRLLKLPGIKGVRVKIAKLEIFDDCEVAIEHQAGQWL